MLQRGMLVTHPGGAISAYVLQAQDIRLRCCAGGRGEVDVAKGMIYSTSRLEK